MGVLLRMTLVTVRASLVRPVWDNGALLHDPWFDATLVDAYCGLLKFFIWVAWRERSVAARVAWFVAIMLPGNLAMSGYVLLELARLGRDASADKLLRSTR